MTVNPADALVVPSISNIVVSYNTPMTPVTLPEASGGVGPYSYQITNLPNGMEFNQGNLELSGTPTQIGQRTATYRVTDDSGETVEKEFNINVESEVHNYTAIVTSRTLSDSTVLVVSRNFPASQTALTLPVWTGLRYLVILVPASQADLMGITFNAAESLSDFEKVSNAVTLAGNSFDAYISRDLQGDSISGFPISIRR